MTRKDGSEGRMEKNSESNTENSESKTCEAEIISSIRENNQECLAPGFVVDKGYIKLVLDTWNRIIDIEIGLDDSSMDDDIADEEAEEILRKIPQDAISRPLSCETIGIIMAEGNAVSTRRFLLETADKHCARACEFNNRANARRELGRCLEAQIDYNRACDIDPNEPAYFLNRAGFFVQLGLIDDAMRDCLHVATLVGSEGTDEEWDLFRLASIFWRCGESLLAAQALLNCLRLVSTLVPYITEDEDGGYIIRKNGRTIHTTGFIGADVISELMKEMEEGTTIEDNAMFSHLMNEVRKEFAALKKLGYLKDECIIIE